MARKVTRCMRCNRRHRGQSTWFACIGSDDVPRATCPDCMSAEDRAEAYAAARGGSFVITTPSAHGVEAAAGKVVSGGVQ